MVHQWINAVFLRQLLIVFLGLAMGVTGCASHIDKVVPKNQKNMKEIYNEKAGSGNIDMIKQREADIRARPVESEDYVSELPPSAAQISHLFPALPNPELYMYVKPHVVGASGAAVPGYMTRFTMYEKIHYAMPNEVVAQVKHPGSVSPPKNEEKSLDKKTTPLHSHGNPR